MMFVRFGLLPRGFFRFAAGLALVLVLLGALSPHRNDAPAPPAPALAR